MVGVAVLCLVAVAGFCTAIWAAWLFHDMPNAADLADYHRLCLGWHPDR